MASEGLAARMAAVGLLGAVLGEGRLMAQVLADPQGPLAGLPPGDRARAQRLALAVLRHVEPADQVLAPHLRKSPPRLVRDAMRLAVVEIALGGAAHGAVNAAVEIVRRGKRTAPFAGLVNAVLRKVPADPFAGLPPQRMPRWLRQPLVHAYGRDGVTAMEAVQAMTPPLDLTLRAGAEAPEGAVLPTGTLRLEEKGQVSALPGYAAGGWWVQDAAAALAVGLLAPQAGERVLDLCAAPGGKTLQLAAAGAAVTAVDLSEPRMARLRENLSRCGLAADLITADALEWQPDQAFDAVLLDAPCSATGTIRRHPDLPFVKDGSELPALVELQARLLDRALGMVRPGGRVVFCTCSLLPDEGEGQLAAALARHPGLRVERVALPGVDEAWWTAEGGLRLRPDLWADRGGMDGFFMVRLGL
ncbi:RsmB/NOP family class I SAM-dependent RNA methyltransferase [Paragemmobacter ruber]|uniref:Methyltransferase domain-containing protein n=1 Tax=Paragemmobacter ruber TaxID=1985673 RepID=A0ABW9Y4X5_9RHOB|nr:transcription antitermination factor NusB [Rhodobacter ruber]NBE07136.1 methyltransferase domain-containing protein [Rhodobacter ruber]